MKIAAAVSIALALAGCATTKPPAWVPADGAFVAASAGFELEGPPGWMRRNLDARVEMFHATRDGTSLQRIVAGTTEVGKPLGFGKSQRLLTADMSPAEIGELVIDDLRSATGFTDVQLLENAPAQVGGRAGFHVLATFREDGLRRRTMLYGTSDGRRLFWIYYLAPERHYFQLDLPTFEKVLATVRLRAAQAPPAARPGTPSS
jgi:hypothetical protein